MVKIISTLLILFVGPVAHAGVFELSLGFSYSRSLLQEGDSTTMTSWGSALAYHFSNSSGLEFSFDDVTQKNIVAGVQDITVHDRIYSINWVQGILNQKSMFQPYFKVGVGQTNRDISGSITFSGTKIGVTSEVDEVTGIGSVGFRLYMTQRFSVKAEGTTRLLGGKLANWKDDIRGKVGISFYF